MRFIFRSAVVGAATAALALPLVAGTASAASATLIPATDQQVADALHRLETTHVLSASDRALLLTRPDVASRVTDPAANTVTTTTTAAQPATSQQLARLGMTASSPVPGDFGFYCAWRQTTLTAHGLTPLPTVYKLHADLNYCYQNGGVIHELVSRHGYLTDIDPTRNFVGFSDDYVSPLRNTYLVSNYTAHIQAPIYLPLLGLVSANSYPYVNMTGMNNGYILSKAGGT